MGMAWKVFVAVFAVGMLFFALGCDGGYYGCNDGTDPGTGDGEPPILDRTHSGWKNANCAICHNNDHTAGLDPYECAECHGDNGAIEPPGWHDANNCTSCHSGIHSSNGFPRPESCVECHL